MRNKDAIIGLVVEALPNTTFAVDVGGQIIHAYLAGKMRKININVRVGDKVEVVLDKYGGKNTNRIVWRK